MMLGKTMGTPIAYVLKDPDHWGSPGKMNAILEMLFWFSIPAVLSGWVLQAIIVAIRSREKHE